MSTEHAPCTSVEDALIAGQLSGELHAHAASCARCQGVIAMTTSIKTELSEVPVAIGQRSQWIAEMHARRARRRRWIAWSGGGLAAATATVAIVLVTISGDHSGGARKPAASIDSTGSSRDTIDPTEPAPAGPLIGAGYVSASPIVLVAPATGTLTAFKVSPGDAIAKGQIVAVVGDGQLRAERSLAKARMRDAQRELERIRRLVNASAATQAELDRAVGRLEIATAETALIETKLDHSNVRSPIDGIVLELLARPGDALASQQGILRIGSRALVVEVNVAEADVKRVFLGQHADVITELPDRATHGGIVREIAQQVDIARGTVLVVVEIREPPAELRPGTAAQVRFAPRR